jgi:hypothetical protein
MFKRLKPVLRVPRVANPRLSSVGWALMILAITCVTATLCNPLHLCADAPVEADSNPQSYDVPASVDEARARARMLHETIHGALQVVHRDFFDEENVHTIPSRSLEDVFIELERCYGVSIRWIAVNAKALNVDHKPRDDFEKKAVRALSSGKDEFESYEAGDSEDSGKYRHVGSIRLASQCLKCHLPTRSSNADRLAGLSIAMQVGEDLSTVDTGNK